jgi:hypothetical protein
MSAQTQTGTRRSEAPGPGLEHLRLEVFIGKWINGGNYVATSEAPVAKIVTSDVYESIPGRLSVLHTANGHIGDLDVGGMEIIWLPRLGVGSTPPTFIDSQGHVIVDELICAGKWIWTGERIRTTAEFSDDRKIQRALHEVVGIAPTMAAPKPGTTGLAEPRCGSENRAAHVEPSERYAGAQCVGGHQVSCTACRLRAATWAFGSSRRGDGSRTYPGLHAGWIREDDAAWRVGST